MKWDDIKGYVGKFAPWVATALGGPLAGSGVKVLCDALGLDPNTTKPEDIDKLFKQGQLTGEQLVALKKAEHDFQIQMQTLNINSIQELERIASNDRDSARKREMAVRDWTPQILAYGVTIGFFGVLSYMLHKVVPEGSKDVLNVMLGSLGTSWVSVINYYFGSSAGSDRKTDIIKKQADGLQ
jgi:hypothetical protein